MLKSQKMGIGVLRMLAAVGSMENSLFPFKLVVIQSLQQVDVQKKPPLKTCMGSFAITLPRDKSKLKMLLNLKYI